MGKWLARLPSEGRNRLVYRALNAAIVLGLLLFALRGLFVDG